MEVDLESSVVSTVNNVSRLTSATSHAAVQVPAGGDAAPLSTPTMPSHSNLGASKVSIATQTTCLLASSDSSSCSSCRNSNTSSLSPASSVEVTVFDKSMWVARSPDTTDRLDHSGSLVDTSSETVFSATRYSNTTYFEESSEASKKTGHSPAPPDSPECPTREVNDLCPLGSPSNSFSNIFPLKVIQDSRDDAILGHSTTTLLSESNPCISPSASTSPLKSVEFESLGSSARRSYKPFSPECEETESSDFESDGESFYTCRAGNEDVSSEKEIDLSFNANNSVSWRIMTEW